MSVGGLGTAKYIGSDSSMRAMINGVQIPIGLRSLILEAPPRSPMEATRFCEACLWTLSFRFDDTGAKPSVCFFGVF